jgi:tartrate-resistant acid phosphatase type 5
MPTLKPNSFLIFSLLFGVLYACTTTQTIQQKIHQLAESKLQEGSVNFFVVGDWGRNGKHHQKEVANQMNETGKFITPDFIISTGDNFYPNGVNSTTDKQWLTSFENIYTGSHLQCKWYAVLGNHDYRGTPQAEIDYSKKSLRWTMPDRYYTLTKKINDTIAARFIFLDSQPLVTHNKKQHSDLALQDKKQQLKWLDSVLMNAKEQWKIVIAHHPIYSSNPRHGNSETLIALLKTRLEKYGVQLYLSGHDHDLQHQKPAGTVDYIVSGAGSQTRRTSAYLTTRFTKDVSGFAAMQVNTDSMHLYFIDYNGNTIYAYSRSK